ncbi:MAG: hydrolase [Anaerolineae bacterium SG8_19]|jgi:lysophospholipase L1-like esterase|nr:MAG: hydrolase [Anaerolineae bacterium SG8_19]
MKTILCYGDSNTWGYMPGTGERFPADMRWTGVLQRELSDDYQIIEEGLNGRTIVWDDPIEGYKNGKDYLIPCLESHRPIDAVVMMLGTNELKLRFSLSAYDIAEGVRVLVDIVQNSEAGPDGCSPGLLLVAPPPVAKLTEYAEMFEGAEAKSRRFGEHYRRIADEEGCDFFDTSGLIVSSDIDGIHLEEGEHQKLGKAVAKVIRKIMS